MALAVVAMASWVVEVALVPVDAKLDEGGQHLAQVLRAHAGGQLYVAALLAIVGAVLLAGFFAALVPLTTVIWILALAATLPRSWRQATGSGATAAG